ncbi:MAG: ribosome recycling factor [Paracoccaceae bacterium]|jgi:ribosome recycling factor
MSDDIEIDLDDLGRRMDGAMTALKAEYISLRTGRASASMLDTIMVDAYGSSMPLNQCGTVNVPESRMLTVNVWDKTLVAAVDKAIRNSGLGLNPVMDGMMLRLPIPELNEERRRDLSRVAAQYAESARISIRNVRRDGMDQIKKAKDTMSEDDQKIWSDEIQELTNKMIVEIDKGLEAKQEDIMQV